VVLCCAQDAGRLAPRDLERPTLPVVSARLTLVSHAPTAATAAAAFARADEPLDSRGQAWADAARGRVDRVTRAICAPALACRQTATALALTPQAEPLIRDWDLGRWRGRTFDQIAADDPAAIEAWLTVPDAAPHGGEPLVALLARVADWLAAVPADGHTAAITHPAVVRAAVLGALSGSTAGFWRIDIAPLTATVFRGGPGRWTLRSTGAPLLPRPLLPGDPAPGS
jgi:broad specificity phosphatase PhoE